MKPRKLGKDDQVGYIRLDKAIELLNNQQSIIKAKDGALREQVWLNRSFRRADYELRWFEAANWVIYGFLVIIGIWYELDFLKGLSLFPLAMNLGMSFMSSRYYRVKLRRLSKILYHNKMCMTDKTNKEKEDDGENDGKNKTEKKGNTKEEGRAKKTKDAKKTKSKS